MTAPQITVTRDLDTCLALRHRVFVEEQGVPLSEERDLWDDEALHLLAHLSDTLIGTARIVINDDVGKIGRVCVLPPARGTGLGAALINACLDVLRARPGLRRASLGAQVPAIGFYEKLGFAAYGPVYDDTGIAHRDMALSL